MSKFYFVSTPIGNLEDITLRALEVLKNCDVIYCEDTRHSLKLLNRYGIKKHLESFHDHTSEAKLNKILEGIQNGKIICYISDAGTPMISDPGYEIAVFLKENNVEYDVIPGVTAFIPALMLSAFPCDKFVFGGFLPRKEGDIEKTIFLLDSVSASVVFYQSPMRIRKTLELFKKIIPDRKIAVVKELTKLYQKCEVGLPFELCNLFEEKERGEFVIVLSPKVKENKCNAGKLKSDFILLQKCGVTRKSAVNYLAVKNNIHSKELYKESLNWEEGSK
jgi:16S rRNA (cytidine1402-2'-O)-methyltransferase